MIPKSVVLNTNFSIKTLLLAERIESKLKYNTQKYVTKASQHVIVNVIKHCSSKTVPARNIARLMDVISNGSYFNVAISTLLCHLCYLRRFRLIFRLIKGPKQPSKKLLMDLLMISGTTLLEFMKPKYLDNHRDYMTMLFTMKAKLTMMEMFDLRQIQRYWNHHRARRNHHELYRAWF